MWIVAAQTNITNVFPSVIDCRCHDNQLGEVISVLFQMNNDAACSPFN